MKNYEIILIRQGENEKPIQYPNVGRVYTSPRLDCVQTAQSIYPEHTLHTAAPLRERDKDESDKDFAVRCVAGLNRIFTDITHSGFGKAALITLDEIIVTLMAGCGQPKGEPADFILEPGEGGVIRMSAYLWQRGFAFEIVGKV